MVTVVAPSFSPDVRMSSTIGTVNVVSCATSRRVMSVCEHRTVRIRDDDEDRIGGERARRDDERLRETDADDAAVAT